MTDHAEAPGYAFFQHKVLEVVGLDLSLYRSEQMSRRLAGFLTRHPGESFFSLGKRLEQDAAFARQVRDFLTINVSEFFRNPARFRDLETHILPVLGARGAVRVWSAGCSIGAEPYSLAIALLESTREGGSVWATDVDPVAIERARLAVYRDQEVREVEPRRLGRYFEHTPDGYRVCPEVRRLVRFDVHDLLRDPFRSTWDLIVCRNVVIYFTEEARSHLYRRFVATLRPGGVLFVGGTEAVLGARDYGLEPLAPFFYRRLDEYVGSEREWKPCAELPQAN